MVSNFDELKLYAISLFTVMKVPIIYTVFLKEKVYKKMSPKSSKS